MRDRAFWKWAYLGKVSKGEKCNVVGCANQAIRSISPGSVADAGLSIGRARRGYLCKAHYKELKKKLRKDRQLELWRMMG